MVKLVGVGAFDILQKFYLEMYSMHKNYTYIQYQGLFKVCPLSTLSMYRTNGVIFFIDYCTAICDT